MSIKEVIQSDNWVLTNVMQGSGSYRVDAKKRFPSSGDNFFSKWGSKKYIDSLVMSRYGKKTSDLNSFSY